MSASKDMPLNATEAFSMAGKVVIVTGAGGNVGGGICEVFAANSAKLVCSDKPDDRLAAIGSRLRLTNPDVAEIPCDLANAKELQGLVDQTLLRFGRLDAIVNCGGIATSAPLEQEKAEDFDRLYHTNVRSIWLLTQYAMEPMRKGGGGSIVNIASINGHRAVFFCSLYGSTKAAVLAMTREMAVELAPYNIRVNSVSPGLIPHAGGGRFAWLMRQLAEPHASRLKQQFGQAVQEVSQNQQPLQRTGHGHDVGMACYYLCSPAARFVTGGDILVDGGKNLEMHASEPRLSGDGQNPWKALREELVQLPDDAWIGELPQWLVKLKLKDAVKV